jgi:hypothetical protein
MRSTVDERRDVRSSQVRTLGRVANRVASDRSSSGTLIPSSAARLTNAAYTSSSMSRICTVLGMNQCYMRSCMIRCNTA